MKTFVTSSLLSFSFFLAYHQTHNVPIANNFRKEIGDEAVWTLSSAKVGNGVDQLRDDNLSTFWQYIFL